MTTHTLGVRGVEGEVGPSASLETALSIPLPGVSGVAGEGGARPFDDLTVAEAGVGGGTAGTVGDVTAAETGTGVGRATDLTLYRSTKVRFRL